MLRDLEDLLSLSACVQLDSMLAEAAATQLLLEPISRTLCHARLSKSI